MALETNVRVRNVRIILEVAACWKDTLGPADVFKITITFYFN